MDSRVFQEAVKERARARGIADERVYFTVEQVEGGEGTVTVRLDHWETGELFAVGYFYFGHLRRIDWADEHPNVAGAGYLGISRFSGMWEGEK